MRAGYVDRVVWHSDLTCGLVIPINSQHSTFLARLSQCLPTSTTVRFPIDVPGALSTNASGINNRGDIVGSYQDASLVSHGFLYDGKHFFTIDFPSGTFTFASGINDRGDIVGTTTPGASLSDGFVYDGVSFAALIFPGAFRTTASGINNPGRIVGSDNSDAVPKPGQALHGFLFDNQHFISTDVPGAFSTTPLGINERGQIVGQYRDVSGGTGTDHGFVANP